jgi:hypothetical protein
MFRYTAESGSKFRALVAAAIGLCGLTVTPLASWHRDAPGWPSADPTLRQDHSFDAPKAHMIGGRIDCLRMARSRAVAAAIVRRAQMRAAFENLAWNPDVGLAGVVARGLGTVARIFRDAAGLRRVGLVPCRPPSRGPFPDIADHVAQTVAVRRKRRRRRCTLIAVERQILACGMRLARCSPSACRPA